MKIPNLEANKECSELRSVQVDELYLLTLILYYQTHFFIILS